MPKRDSIKYQVLSIKYLAPKNTEYIIQNTRYNEAKGFSLVEILISVFLIAVISTILISITNTLHTRRRNDLSALANKAAAKEIEHVRNQNFAAIGSHSLQSCSSDFSQSSSSTYLPNCQISQTVCDYEVNGCPLPTPTTAIKLVSITVQWKYQNQTKFAVVETLISPGGL